MRVDGAHSCTSNRMWPLVSHWVSWAAHQQRKGKVGLCRAGSAVRLSSSQCWVEIHIAYVMSGTEEPVNVVLSSNSASHGR